MGGAARQLHRSDNILTPAVGLTDSPNNPGTAHVVISFLGEDNIHTINVISGVNFNHIAVKQIFWWQIRNATTP